MDNELELITLAGKALGYSVEKFGVNADGNQVYWAAELDATWMPHVNQADSLKLREALELHVLAAPLAAVCWKYGNHPSRKQMPHDGSGADSTRAGREAVLLMAAEIGRERVMSAQAPRTERRVICAAIRADDGALLLGIRHYSADMHKQIEQRKDGKKFRNRLDEDQGFVDQWGVFMSRSGAYRVAVAAGQLRYPEACGKGIDGPKLYSEGLY